MQSRQETKSLAQDAPGRPGTAPHPLGYLEWHVLIRRHGLLYHSGNCSDAQCGGSDRYRDGRAGGKRVAPLTGGFAFVLFALGILGVGLIGVPVLAGSVAQIGNGALSAGRPTRAVSVVSSPSACSPGSSSIRRSAR
jgi:hypothetical protein